MSADSSNPNIVERLAALEARVRLLEALLDVSTDLPVECRERRCNYYRHYLADEPAGMSHSRYHDAERQYATVSGLLNAWYDEHPDSRCSPHDRDAARLERLLRL